MDPAIPLLREAGFDVRHLEPRPPNAPIPLEEEARAALEDAGFLEWLRASAGNPAPVTVVVNDPHRATRSPPILRAIRKAADAVSGTGPEFRLLVATGSHPVPPDEARRAFEAPLCTSLETEEVHWHDASAAASHAGVGDAGFRIHRFVAPPASVISVGSVEPHYFAGLTGAHKTVTIGVLARRAIERNHESALEAGARGWALHGNPVFEGVRSMVRALEAGGTRIFGINQVLIADRPIVVRAGHVLDILRKSRPLLQGAVPVLSAPVDLVISRVAPPLDRSLYQADKGIQNVAEALRPGGVLLLDAACPHGVGPDRYFQLLEEAPTLARVRSRLARDGYRLGDHKALRLRRLTDPESRNVSLGLLAPGLPGEAVRRVGFEWFDDPTRALAWAIEKAPGRTALVVQDAGNQYLRRTGSNPV